MGNQRVKRETFSGIYSIYIVRFGRLLDSFPYIEKMFTDPTSARNCTGTHQTFDQTKETDHIDRHKSKFGQNSPFVRFILQTWRVSIPCMNRSSVQELSWFRGAGQGSGETVTHVFVGLQTYWHVT